MDGLRRGEGVDGNAECVQCGNQARLALPSLSLGVLFFPMVAEAVFHGSRGQLLICPRWEVRVFTRVVWS